jgi:CheY-like chemotaxis protein
MAGKSVRLVEDEALIRMMIVEMLEELGSFAPEPVFRLKFALTQPRPPPILNQIGTASTMLAAD